MGAKLALVLFGAAFLRCAIFKAREHLGQGLQGPGFRGQRFSLGVYGFDLRV